MERENRSGIVRTIKTEVRHRASGRHAVVALGGMLLMKMS
jgi:hypothetical protein